MLFKKSIDADSLVRSFYKVLMGREPDKNGFTSHVKNLKQNGIDAALSAFIHSGEFRRRMQDVIPPGFMELNRLGAMDISLDGSSEDLDALWQHVQDTWSNLGDSEPLWSVITNQQLLQSSKPDLATVTQFYEGGAYDLGYFQAYLSRAGLTLANFNTVAEYGCGVGRVTPWLARDAVRVKGFDISTPHLRLAQKHCDEQSITNVDFVHVKDRASLRELCDIDVFFSLIVLQHNPPPIIMDVLDCAFKGLNSGGIAFFQIPVFKKDYRFHMQDYLGEVKNREMEMHFVPQRLILRLAHNHGLKVLEIRNDHCINMYSDAISSTFLLQKS